MADGSGTIKFASPGATFTTIDSGPSNGVTINPTNNDVLVSDLTYVVEYDSSGTQIGAKWGEGKLISVFGIGLDRTASHAFLAENWVDSAYAFVSSGLLPVVSTGAAQHGAAATQRDDLRSN